MPVYDLEEARDEELQPPTAPPQPIYESSPIDDGYAVVSRDDRSWLSNAKVNWMQDIVEARLNPKCLPQFNPQRDLIHSTLSHTNGYGPESDLTHKDMLPTLDDLSSQLIACKKAKKREGSRGKGLLFCLASPLLILLLAGITAGGNFAIDKGFEKYLIPILTTHPLVQQTTPTPTSSTSHVVGSGGGGGPLSPDDVDYETTTTTTTLNASILTTPPVLRASNFFLDVLWSALVALTAYAIGKCMLAKRLPGSSLIHELDTFLLQVGHMRRWFSYHLNERMKTTTVHKAYLMIEMALWRLRYRSGKVPSRSEQLPPLYRKLVDGCNEMHPPLPSIPIPTIASLDTKAAAKSSTLKSVETQSEKIPAVVPNIYST